MRITTLILLAAAAMPALAEQTECKQSLARVEAASRSAQEALLVARARDEKPQLAEPMAALEQSMTGAEAACGDVSAQSLSETGGIRDLGEDLTNFGAETDKAAQKGSERLKRSQRGY